MQYQFELWTNETLLHSTEDAGEMVIHYRDARKVYKPDDLQLIALVPSEFGTPYEWKVDYSWLVDYIQRTDVP